MARVPTRATEAPAAPELGSDPRPPALRAALAPSFPSPPSGPWLRSRFPALLLRASSLGVAGAFAGPWALCAQLAERGAGLGQGRGMGKRVPAECRASGRCCTHGTQAIASCKRPRNALHIWGRGCAGITGLFQGKGLDAGVGVEGGGGTAPHRSCSGGPCLHPTSSLGAVPAPASSLGKER